MVELLKRFEEKENLFANFPIGATIQDGGKRKRSAWEQIISYSMFYTLLQNILTYL